MLDVRSNSHVLMSAHAPDDLQVLDPSSTTESERLVHKFQDYETQVRNFITMYQFFDQGNQELKKMLAESIDQLKQIQ